MESLAYQRGQIWAPDVTMYEKVQETVHTHELIVSPDGSIVVSTPRTSKFACPLVLSKFPFDVQKCHFTIG